eukprot:366078-Chlamydomonas_euryale.AAC.2
MEYAARKMWLPNRARTENASMEYNPLEAALLHKILVYTFSLNTTRFQHSAARTCQLVLRCAATIQLARGLRGGTVGTIKIEGVELPVPHCMHGSLGWRWEDLEQVRGPGWWMDVG